MLAFVKDMKRQFIANKKFSNYLIYAVGEIFLIVMGILIALQIDNWNNEKADRQNELKTYQNITAKRITVEYCMINKINDSIESAKALIKLLRPFKVNINLIELNPFDGCQFSPSGSRQIQAFAKILTNAGIETVIRFKRGRSIKAACGQLGATWLIEK